MQDVIVGLSNEELSMCLRFLFTQRKKVSFVDEFLQARRHLVNLMGNCAFCWNLPIGILLLFVQIWTHAAKNVSIAYMLCHEVPRSTVSG